MRTRPSGTMTMGVERTLTTSLNASSREEEDHIEASISNRSRYVLSAPFIELEEETFSFVEQVHLCLTVDGEVLVWRKISEFPSKYSLLRKHDLRTSQIMEHPLLPDALQIQAMGTTVVKIYQAVKDLTESSMKKWISKARASKSRRSSTSSNTHSRNGPKVNARKSLLPKLSLGAKSKTTTAVNKTANSIRSRTYSSPSSPVAQNRSILAAVLASRSQLSSANSLHEDGEEQEGEQVTRQPEDSEAAGGTSTSTTTAIEQQQNGSCIADEDNDVVVITNGNCDDEGTTPPPHKAEEESTTEKVKIKEDVLMLVNGHADLAEATGNRDPGHRGDEEDDKRSMDCIFYDDEELETPQFSREHRSSLRLELKKPSSEFIRTYSDRYLGHHRALSSIEEGAVLMTRFSRNSSSASKLDELKENGHSSLSLNGSGDFPGLNQETRSHGTSTPSTPPVALTAPRTPSPLTPVPLSSSSPTEGNGFLGRFHHMQIRNRKVKCSPRINRSASVQTPPNFNILSELTNRSSSSAAVLPSSLVLMTKNGEVNSTTRSATPTQTSSSLAAAATATPSSSSSKHPSGCSTLPRSNKRRKNSRPPSANSRDPRAAITSSMGQFAPSSPVPVKQLPPKSPKLLRIFHRRWQSSSAIKVPLSFDDGTSSPSGSVPSTPVHGSSAHSPKKLHLYDSLEVAEELTMLDSELLRKIDQEELQNGAWMKKDKDSLAPNVMAMVRSFNQLALLVPSQILEEKTPQGRAKIISAYIQIASKCYRLRNYNSLKAILGGLQSTPIFRLKKTWKEVPSKRRKRFEQLCDVMSESDNGQRYQAEIEKLLLAEESFIPFLGSFLTQVVHQDSYNEIRAKREKSVCSSASQSDDSQQLQTASPSRQIFSRRPNGLQVPKPNVVTHRRSSSLMSSVLDRLKEEDDAMLSKSAPSSPVPCHQKTLDYERGKTPEDDGEDEVDWAGHSENSLAEHDSGLYSASSHRSTSIPKSSSLNSLNHEEREVEVQDDVDRCNSAEVDLSGQNEYVDLRDIYVKLKRKSKSFESLLNAFTEKNPGMNDYIQSGLKEMIRFSANCDGDSVFSEDDHLTENDTSSINLDLSHGDHEGDLSAHRDSLESGTWEGLPVRDHGAAMKDDDADATPRQMAPTSAENRILMSLRDLGREMSETPHVENAAESETAVSRRRRTLLRAQSEQISLETKLREIEQRRRSEAPHESSPEVVENEGREEKRTKKKRSVQRSLSYNNSAAGRALRRRRRKKSGSVCDERLSSSDREKSVEPPTPFEMLNLFKIASLRFSVSFESKSTLRTLICDAQPNTENDNYKLSLDREQQ